MDSGSMQQEAGSSAVSIPQLSKCLSDNQGAGGIRLLKHSSHTHSNTDEGLMV